jgi:phosphopantetheinyl transferase (holo-ACP synthase)
LLLRGGDESLGNRWIGTGWREIEIPTSGDARPSVKLYGQALRKAAKLNLKEVSIGLSDSKSIPLL